MSSADLIGLLGILVGLGLLIWFAFKGWSVLLLAPLAAGASALFAHEPVLAHWTQTFMRSAAGFVGQFFPLFLLGALFGKLMEDSGSVTAIADFMTKKLGAGRVILAVVLGGAIVTYGGVSLFVAFFVIALMAQNLFRSGGIPRRLMPAAIMLGTSTFTMSAMPGTPSIQNTIPMPFFGTTPFARRGSAFWPRRSCWGSASGGCSARRRQRKCEARASARVRRELPSRSPKTRPCASARLLPANSIRLKLSTERPPCRSNRSPP